MSENIDSLKIRALEIAAAVGGESAEETVKRATSYHTFLSGVAKATAPQPATSAKGDTSAAGTSGKGNTSAPPPKNTAGKPAAANKPAAGAAANKPAAGAAANKPAASKQNVGAPEGAFPPDDTKAPGGKNDFAAMCKKLRAVMQDSTNGGKTEASRILAEDGNGATSVRNLDKAYYDAVVEACDGVLNPDDGEGHDAGGEGEGDDLGL